MRKLTTYTSRDLNQLLSKMEKEKSSNISSSFSSVIRDASFTLIKYTFALSQGFSILFTSVSVPFRQAEIKYLNLTLTILAILLNSLNHL